MWSWYMLMASLLCLFLGLQGAMKLMSWWSYGILKNSPPKVSPIEMEKSMESESRFKTTKQSNKMWVIAFHLKKHLWVYYLYIYICLWYMKFLRQTSHQLYQQHLLQQLPKFLEAPHEIFANGHDSTNGSGIGISIVDFLVALSRLGQGNGLLASTPKGGWIPGPEKLVPKRWRIFLGFHFVVF